MADSKEMRAGSVEVICPECEELIVVEVNCRIVYADESENGQATLMCDPDMTDLWAHVWMHNDA